MDRGQSVPSPAAVHTVEAVTPAIYLVWSEAAVCLSYYIRRVNGSPVSSASYHDVWYVRCGMLVLLVYIVLEDESMCALQQYLVCIIAVYLVYI